MAIGFRAFAEATGSASTDITITVPSGTVDGDAMVMQLHMPLSVTVPTISGWTLGRSDSLGIDRRGWYWRVAASEPASYTVTFDASGNSTGRITSYSGTHATAPIDVEALNSPGGESASPSSPSVTTTGPGDWLLWLGYCVDNRTWTVPSVMTQRGTSITRPTDGGRQVIATEALSASGATGTRTGSLNSATNWACFAVALKSAAVAASVPAPPIVATHAALVRAGSY